MATDVIMPALGMSQEKGKILKWLKREGESVSKGEPLMEIETDKATVEVEAPATGILASVSATEGEEVPVAQVIALILAPGEAAPSRATFGSAPAASSVPSRAEHPALFDVTPVAKRVAAENNVDLAAITPKGSRIEKSDIVAYLEAQKGRITSPHRTGRLPASPKARCLAAERGIDLATLRGTGPSGAIQAQDILSGQVNPKPTTMPQTLPLSNIWQIMVERISQSWTTVPHFYLLREVNATQLISWHAIARRQSTEKITITDLLVKIVAVALSKHPRVNASWKDKNINLNQQINIGIAVAIEDGLVAPVIQQANELAVDKIAQLRNDLVTRAQSGKLRLEDISGGTFTVSNLGMYGVDTFNAIVNPPQAALLAVGRITERVVALNGQPCVQPTMMLSLSCDHRVVDGARGAEFLRTVADLIEEPAPLLQ